MAARGVSGEAGGGWVGGARREASVDERRAGMLRGAPLTVVRVIELESQE